VIHFVIIVFFLALIIGTAAIARISLIRRQSRLRFLFFLFFGILFLNLGALTAIISYYLKANIANGISGTLPLIRFFFKWNGVWSTALLGGLNISFLLMIAAFFNKNLPSFFKRILFIGWAGIFAVQTTANILGRTDIEFVLHWLVNHIITTSVFMVGGVYFLLTAGKTTPQYLRKRQLDFARIQLVWILSWVLVRFFYYSELITAWAFVLFEAILFLVTNLLVLLFLKGFTTGIQSGFRFKQVSPELQEERFAGFGITKREQEIIRLICEGKSNREIKDRLFISLQSVKDHVYRIYRKTEVKNRVQLANLFSADETETD
jgi:DNA-binding CsgD family transcriptional regulator